MRSSKKYIFSEQRIRAFLFYLSVFIFCTGLPFILSFALGYKFDRRSLKFTKTGLVVLKTQPPQASIYLDNRLLKEKTPAALDELLPGVYHLTIEMENYYPWSDDVRVDARKVTRLDKIILFPLLPHIKKMNKERLSYFWLDEEKENIYYVAPEARSIYKSDLSGERHEKVADFLDIAPEPVKWKVSADKTKLLYFNDHQIGIAPLQAHREAGAEFSPFVLPYSTGGISDVFWHSDSYHIIIVGNKNVEVMETRHQSSPVSLVKANKSYIPGFYDQRSDTLYFMDFQKAADGNFYDNLYKLNLNAQSGPLREILRKKQDE